MYRLFITGDLGFEFWMDVPGYEGFQASTYGRIRKDGVVLTPKKVHIYKTDYLYLNLGKIAYVHRLVASAFLPNPSGKPEVDHRNGDTENNNVWNLRFVTHRENLNNPVAVQKNRVAKQDQFKKVYAYDGQLNLIGIYDSIMEASRQTGCRKGNISHCLNGHRKRAGGIMFRPEPLN